MTFLILVLSRTKRPIRVAADNIVSYAQAYDVDGGNETIKEGSVIYFTGSYPIEVTETPEQIDQLFGDSAWFVRSGNVPCNMVTVPVPVGPTHKDNWRTLGLEPLKK